MKLTQEIMMDQELKSHFCKFKTNAIIIEQALLNSQLLLVFVLF